MSPRTRRIAALCCATGLVLSACGSDGTTDAAVSTAAPATAAPATAAPATPEPATTAPADTATSDTAASGTVAPAAAVVPASLQFSAPLVGGGTFDGASVAGAPVVFWFWAPG